MKKLHFILILFIVLLAPDVFAQEVNVTSNCYGTTGYSGMYNGHEVQYQTDSLYNFGTTYEKQLSSFETQLRYSLSANTDYVITFNTNNTDDFRNNFKTYNVYDNNNNDNNLVKSFTFVSMKKVQISFRTTSATNRVTIQMGGSNNYDNITGVNNWNIKSAILTIPDSSPSGSTNQDIIDNQTNNTNNIINNNNQNTSDIINNNNQNTENITNSIENGAQAITDVLGNRCANLLNPDTSVNGAFSDNDLTGTLNNTTNTVTSDWINVKPNTSYCISGANRWRWQFKNSSNNITRSFWQNDCVVTDNDTYFLRIYYYYNPAGNFVNPSSITNVMLNEGTSSKPYCEYGSYSSKLDDTTSAINDVNNSINNSNVENGTGQGFFDDFTSQDFGLSQIITIPLNTIQSLTSKSCVPLQVPIPFTNSNLSLPCMTEIYQNKLPTVYNLWKIVSFGIVAYLIAIDIFHIVKGFKDPESDKVEVLDL